LIDKGSKITPVEKFFGNPDELTTREIELAKRSPSTKRRIRAEARMRRGFHPFGMALREPRGETCGTCLFAVAGGASARWYKCQKSKITGGMATDLRLKWAACNLWADGMKKV